LFQKLLIKFVPVLLTLVVVGFPMTTLAAPPMQQDEACTDYIIQAGDTLSAIAIRVYDDMEAYTQIVSATNQLVTADSPYVEITDPNSLEVGQTICVPAGDGDTAALLAAPTDQPITDGATGLSPTDVATSTGIITATTTITTPDVMTETVTTGVFTGTPSALADQLQLTVSNRSLANASSTLTLSGGQFEGGETFILEAGQSEEIALEPGDYRVTWTSPASDLDFNQSFTAVSGNVADVWIVPEAEQVSGTFAGISPARTPTTPALTSTESASMTAEAPTFTFVAEEGKALLVAGNRSLSRLPATLTLSGGEVGQGEAFALDSGQQLAQSLAPGQYRFTWSSPGSDIALNGQFEVRAGDVLTSWYVPEDGQAIMQTKGEAPIQIQ